MQVLLEHSQTHLHSAILAGNTVWSACYCWLLERQWQVEAIISWPKPSLAGHEHGCRW